MESYNYNCNGYLHHDHDSDFGYKQKNYIEHPVSRFDTLAGIAIKYGVEVSDIKKMNGLVTDLQFFALKILHIPLPGKHPPSPCLSNASETPGQNNVDQTPPRRVPCDLLDSLQSLRLTSSSERKVSPAMSTLQGYYGLKSAEQNFEDGPFLKRFPTSNPPLGCHRRSGSYANFFSDNSESDSDKWNDKSFRRRQKSEADFSASTPELLLKEDNSPKTVFSTRTGKSLALRPKAASRNALESDTEGCGFPLPFGLEDSLVGRLSGVRKSSSMSCLEDQDGNNSSSSSLWPSPIWPDLQALSSVSITKPIFDGLPKPISGRRNKAALD